MSENALEPAPPQFGDNPFRWLASRYRVLLLRRAFHRSIEIARYALVRPKAMRRFHIVSAQRNMRETALRCLESVHVQAYPKEHIRHIFIDDASTDSTPEAVDSWLKEHPGHRVTFIRNTERVGMLANNLAGFRLAEDADIGVELNGDDWLPDAGVLRFLNKVYDNPDVWMTYNTLRQTDGTIVFQLPPSRAVRRSLDYRRAPWTTSHLHTFRVALYHHLPAEHLKDPASGEPWELSQDMAVYLSMLELAGDHARHMFRVTCTYHPHSASDHIRDRKSQLEAEARIRSLPPCQALSQLNPSSATRSSRSS